MKKDVRTPYSDGLLNNALKKEKAKLEWTTMNIDPGRLGIVIWLMFFSDSTFCFACGCDLKKVRL